jgi:PAS domain S-box-containing protein
MKANFVPGFEFNVLMDASIGIVLLDASSLRIEAANNFFRNHILSKRAEADGSQFFTALPGSEKILPAITADTTGKRTSADISIQNSEGNFKIATRPLLVSGEEKILVFIDRINDDENSSQKKTSSFREREETFRLLIENSKDGISLTDAKGITVYVSPAAQKILGYSETEIAGSHGREHIHPEDVVRLGEIFRDFGPGKSVTYEMRVRHKDMQYRWIEVTTTNLLHISGIDAIVSNFRDVTERKLHEEESMQREREMRNLANAMPQLVWIAEPDGNVSYYNERITEYAGAFKSENSWTWSPLLHPDDLAKTNEAWTYSVQHKTAYSVEHRVKMKDGSYRYHLSRAYPHLNDRGEVLQWFGTATDIAEQKEAQQILEQYARELSKQVEQRTSEYKKQKEFAETILDSSIDVVAVYDRDTRLMMANKKHLDQFHLGKEHIGKTLLEIFPHAHENYERLMRAMSGEALFYPAIKSKDADSFFESYVKPLKDADGNVYAALVIAHDVTQFITATEMLKESADQLKSANESLIKQNEELEQFAYVASHDLQEPLRKIATFARMLEKSLSSNTADSERYIQKIIQSSNRMSELIRDVLKFSQLTNSESVTMVNLNETLSSIMTDLELLIEQKKAAFHFDDLPVIEAVPRQMTQLFYNLISNSLKFSRPDQEIQIKIACARMPEETKNDAGMVHYKISFSDNGIGFNPSYADKIFMMFQRLNTREHYSGSGIGLAMVKKIVSNHHGYVIAESEEGKGATFHVILPDRQTHGPNMQSESHE